MTSLRFCTLAAALVVVTACGESLTVVPADPPPDVGTSDDMFVPQRVLDIDIEMPEADWDALRYQTRSLFDVVGSSCLMPPVRPFTYFRATVTIDGTAVSDVAVRKKGFFGSLDTNKPSLKVKFNEYVPGRRFSGMKRLTLNNNKSDSAHIKQCLGYDFFAANGIPSPRCNFARVSINGRDLGVFTHVESIKKDFVRRNFVDPEGNLYEGALSDFRPGWVDTFQKKTNKEDPDRSDIEALVPVFEAPDAQLVAAVAPHFDLAALRRFWAAELVVGHADGYARNTNNFYIYNDPSIGKFSLIPWGIDSIFNEFDFTLPWETVKPSKVLWTNGVMANRLYRVAGGPADYFAALDEVLATWDETHLVSEIDRMQQLLTPHLATSELGTFNDAVSEVRTFVQGRRAAIDAERTLGTPGIGPTLRDPWCVDAIGQVDGTFATTWGTYDMQDVFAAGTGTMNIEVGGTTMPVPDAVGSKSGMDDFEPVIQIVSFTDPRTVRVAHLVLGSGVNGPGSYPIDWLAVSGWAIEYELPAPGCVPPPGQAQCSPTIVFSGMLGDGTLQIDQGSDTPGAPVTGSYDATIYESIF